MISTKPRTYTVSTFSTHRTEKKITKKTSHCVCMYSNHMATEMAHCSETRK